MMEKFWKDQSLIELMTGIGLTGFVFWLLGFLFPFWIKDMSLLKYAVGLWTGVLVAEFSAFHMWQSLQKAFLYDEKGAGRVMASGYIVRYLITGVFLVGLYYSGWGYILAGFLGVMCLKFAAYEQPLIHKLLNFIIRR